MKKQNYLFNQIQHFNSLSIHDRLIILRGAVENVTCLGGSFSITSIWIN